MGNASAPRRPKGLPTLGLLAATVLAIALGLAALPRVEAYFLDRAKSEGEATLRLVSDSVNQTLRRFDPVPRLVAERPILGQVLREPENEGLLPFVNEQLRQTALSVGASDIYLMDRSGLTIAASNYRHEATFIGQTFDYRPYFRDALAGSTARYHALGTTSGERGFFFAAPVLDGIAVEGVLAVKVTVEAIEDSWAGLGRDVLVSDANGVIFMASRPDLRLRTLAPLSPGTEEAIRADRQYPLEDLKPVTVEAAVIAPGSVEVQIAADGPPGRFLADSRALQQPGWHATVLTPLPPIRAQALMALATWVLFVLVLALATFVVLQRRARIAERLRIQAAERDLLEARVAERTAELDRANADLKVEVVERTQAEEQLRRTQRELVQAGKLAALGQMSAALSHEINQPLAAVRSYADNAATFLDRDRVAEARENVTRISEMADRMARISGHLRNFARRPGDRLGAVPVGEVVSAAVALVAPEARARGAEIAVSDCSPDIWATGGRLRLEQVIVNVLTNALDAMREEPSPRIEVHVEAGEARVDIVVRDHGPGLSAEAEAQVFEPFFTTKEAGEGMGLGLSISYNIIADFGGSLTAGNHPGGGAVFRISLVAAGPDAMVAE